MDLKDTIKYAIGLSKPEIVTVDGRNYTDRDLAMITEPTLARLTVHTLSAVVNYVNTRPDNGHTSDHLLIHVADHDQVVVYDHPNDDEYRVPLVNAVLHDFSPPFGKFIDVEEFNIIMQSRFVQNEDSAKILAMVGSLADENIKTVGDDGVTQQVTVRTGIQYRENVIVPNPVTLIPYRTFTEAAQPASKFVFRLRKGGEPEAALFEADGGAWKNQAIENIVEFLAAEITDTNYTILA